MALNNLSRSTLQKALEVSIDRWYRHFQAFRELNQTKSYAQKRLQDIATRFGIGLGLIQRDSNYPQESSLLGPAIGALAYSFIVCWGQSYVVLFVFSTWLFGSLIIFLLFRLLGSSHSVLEVTSTIGYSMAPIILLEPLMTLTEEPLPGLSLVVKIIAVAWSSRCASIALIQPVTEKKTFLFACPLILFNVYLLSLRNGA